MDEPVMMNCAVPMWEEFMEAMPWSVLGLLGIALTAYFFGCFNGAVIVSKYILRDDVRNHGSGNAGLTNFHRAFGGKLTALVLLLDVVKMFLAVRLGSWLLGQVMPMGDISAHILTEYWCGLWCLLGHMFPITFGFKGGKGVLSGVTLLFLLDWRMGLIALAIFLTAVLLTRYISLGSCLAALSFPLGTWLFVSHDPLILALSILLAGLVIFMHRANIRRLLKGEESKFSLHRKKS